MNCEHLLILCTCSDEATAERLATALVQEGLAACVNRLPVHSTYIWNGAVQTEPELQLLIKTTAGRYEALENRLRALHPYELPEIIAVPIVRGLPGYLDWISTSTQAQRPSA
jgi:periplasmic divalent cation tolerance protein